MSTLDRFATETMCAADALADAQAALTTRHDILRDPKALAYIVSTLGQISGTVELILLNLHRRTEHALDQDTHPAWRRGQFASLADGLSLARDHAHGLWLTLQYLDRHATALTTASDNRPTPVDRMDRLVHDITTAATHSGNAHTVLMGPILDPRHTTVTSRSLANAVPALYETALRISTIARALHTQIEHTMASHPEPMAEPALELARGLVDTDAAARVLRRSLAVVNEVAARLHIAAHGTTVSL